MIGLTLKNFLSSVLAPSIPDTASFVYIFVCVPEIYSITETKYKVISIKISDMNLKTSWLKYIALTFQNGVPLFLMFTQYWNGGSI